MTQLENNYFNTEFLKSIMGSNIKCPRNLCCYKEVEPGY